MAIAFQRLLGDGALPFATASVLLLAFLLGGGTQQGFWSDAIVQLASLPLLGLVLLSPKLMAVSRGAVILACLLLALPMAQLLPLPPMLWTALPGREEIARAYDVADIALPWLPISLVPNNTWRSAFSLLPALAIFLATQCLRDRARLNLVLILMAVAFVSVLLDLLQVMGGAFSPLRFYAITNPERAVGFFANSNHNAAFLYCVIPFVVAYGIELRRQPGRAILMFLLFGGLILGLSLTQSRAGLIIAAIAGLLCIPLLVGYGNAGSRKRLVGVVMGCGVIALLIAFQFGFVNIVKRSQESDLLGDLRWPVAEATLKAAQANLPLGTGYGTFVSVYQSVETRSMLLERYINRAHNDWLELALEGGVLSMVALLVFLGWFGRECFRVWRPHRKSRDGGLDLALARAGSIAIVLLLLHSIVDYPLRTTGLMVLFALSFALMIARRAPANSVEKTLPSDSGLSIRR